ncbi:MAG: hypothetical protein IJT65_01945 [Eubacterium sp.]|nr:hypothetical protein [Eubacterium sp.]
MTNKKYSEPEFNIVQTSSQDIMTVSGGDDFNMLGDKPNTVYFKNSNWTIEI